MNKYFGKYIQIIIINYTEVYESANYFILVQIEIGTQYYNYIFGSIILGYIILSYLNYYNLLFIAGKGIDIM